MNVADTVDCTPSAQQENTAASAGTESLQIPDFSSLADEQAHPIAVKALKKVRVKTHLSCISERDGGGGRDVNINDEMLSENHTPHINIRRIFHTSMQNYIEHLCTRLGAIGACVDKQQDYAPSEMEISIAITTSLGVGVQPQVMMNIERVMVFD